MSTFDTEHENRHRNQQLQKFFSQQKSFVSLDPKIESNLNVRLNFIPKRSLSFIITKILEIEEKYKEDSLAKRERKESNWYYLISLRYGLGGQFNKWLRIGTLVGIFDYALFSDGSAEAFLLTAGTVFSAAIAIATISTCSKLMKEFREVRSLVVENYLNQRVEDNNSSVDDNNCDTIR
jgi:hypothetical protein